MMGEEGGERRGEERPTRETATSIPLFTADGACKICLTGRAGTGCTSTAWADHLSKKLQNEMTISVGSLEFKQSVDIV